MDFSCTHITSNCTLVDGWWQLDYCFRFGAASEITSDLNYAVSSATKRLIEQCTDRDCARVIQSVKNASLCASSFRVEPAVYALACCFKHAGTECEVCELVVSICRTVLQFSCFFDYVYANKDRRACLQNTASHWFEVITADELINQIFMCSTASLRKIGKMYAVLRPKISSHVKRAILSCAAHPNLFKRALNKLSVDEIPEILRAADRVKTAGEYELVRLILMHNFPMEFVPFSEQNNKKIWDALLYRMTITSMLEQLGKMTAVDLLRSSSAGTATVVRRLLNAAMLQQENTQPMQLFFAKKQYIRGQNSAGLTWKPVDAIVKALNNAFYASLKRLAHMPGKIVLAVTFSEATRADALTLAEITAVLAIMWLNAGADVRVYACSSRIRRLSVSRKTSLEQLCSALGDESATAYACLAYEHILKHRIVADSFVLVSVSSVDMRACKALNEYRATVCKAKSVILDVRGQASHDITPDRLTLIARGVDASVLAGITEFIKK